MSSLPPGPRWTVWQTIAFARDPFGTILRYARHYGDPFTLKLPPGPLVLTGTPEGIQQIFTAPPQMFASYSTPFLAPLVGEHSVLLLDGAAHKRGRSVIMPPFHGARLQTYGRLIQDLALKHAAAWQPGQTFQMHAVMQALSMEIILTVIFGVRAPGAGPSLRARRHRLLPDVHDAARLWYALTPGLRWLRSVEPLQSCCRPPGAAPRRRDQSPEATLQR